MLTYNGVRDVEQWKRFTAFVQKNTKEWKVKYWCATMETTKAGHFHIHLFLQFATLPDRSSKAFSFESLTPRADCNDSLGEGFCKRKLQESLDRAFFYVWADKICTQSDPAGNECIAGNYFPSWTGKRCTYAVKGRWPYNLWQAHKLAHDVYNDYLFRCRDGVIYRKRNLEACKEEEEQRAQQAEVDARVKRIRSNAALFQPFPVVPEAQAWLKGFHADELRYPIMLVLGRSHTGKTEWACSLFQRPLKLKVGGLEHFPEGMRNFKRGYHDGIVLDDLRDLNFLVVHQDRGRATMWRIGRVRGNPTYVAHGGPGLVEDKLQGKYDGATEFASTPSGQHAYFRDLFAVPVVATANFSTANLHLLDQDDFLANPKNRLLVPFPPWPEGRPTGVENLTFL